ncbi:3-oxoacyl-[acyl-carrier-protein] synthase 3 [Gemmata obscuriglobus]|nr:beta-ketoacyl-ACP synthase III [Gemmata obscuriglobus]QEG29766.1 3-oxoacyl-[acyl-carrier-protein] synthase 3 [Gemmata obscuriglobus]VTS09083.1 3-oxoacyl-(acyl-carrier-protein) synthase iii : 3-oxoacyl-[acyl-carrier-protein] synthase 3 OS=Isosphaera pallida (strain ATCC 43644 / DSM 9630 / IS1B) GN=fabH PE=3 SV=1: ACP_syn_III: ACP_syn_III_C [Gemmata obscuriglobus UQM 2246]
MSERATTRPKCRSLMGVRVVGTGKYVPDMVVSNDHLHAKLGFDSDWIVKRTGIMERRHAAPAQATSDLCVEAANDLFAKTGRTARDCDLLVLGTFTPDMSFPSTACLVQDRIGLIGPAIEVEAACAGFMYALLTASAYVKSGCSDRALVIGGDTNSRVLNPTDIKTYPLFGDGAGAVFVEPGRPDQGVIAYSMGSEGSGGPLLQRVACGSRTPVTPELLAEGKHFMYMDGYAVFKWAVNILCDTIREVLTAANLTVEDVGLFVVHQANIRIINAAIDSLNIPRNKVYNNLERYGNTSAGSIPIALDEAAADGRLKDGDLVVLSGFGAGLAWGTAVIRW